MQPRLRALSIQKGWTISMHSSVTGEGTKKTSREMHNDISKMELELEKVPEKVTTVCELAAFSG